LVGSAQVLAALWSSAWAEGGGVEIPDAEIREYQGDELQPICRGDKNIVPSLSLQTMIKSGKFEPPKGQ
jgi:hypothetical protein